MTSVHDTLADPRVRRVLIRCVLVMALITIVGDLVAWGMGANVTAGDLVQVVLSVLVVALILTRWQLRRAAGKSPAAEL